MSSIPHGSRRLKPDSKLTKRTTRYTGFDDFLKTTIVVEEVTLELQRDLGGRLEAQGKARGGGSLRRLAEEVSWSGEEAPSQVAGADEEPDGRAQRGEFQRSEPNCI